MGLAHMYILVYTVQVFLEKVISALNKRNIPYAVAGGYAVAFHGAVRGTVDIDIIVGIDEVTLVAVEEAMKTLGLVSRIPVTAKELSLFREEYIKNKNLKVWSFVNPSWPVDVVDIMILYNLKEFKTIKKKTAFGEISIVSLEDLIKMKEQAGRPQDLADIEALRKILEGK